MSESIILKMDPEDPVVEGQSIRIFNWYQRFSPFKEGTKYRTNFIEDSEIQEKIVLKETIEYDIGIYKVKKIIGNKIYAI